MQMLFTKTFKLFVTALIVIGTALNLSSCSKEPDVTIYNMGIEGAPSINMFLDQTGKLKITYDGIEYVVTPTFTWSSSDPSVVAINSQTGEYWAKSIGECTIKVVNNESQASAECCAKVSPIDVEKIELDHTTKTALIGEVFTLTATITPTNATYAKVDWSSSNSDIATVDAEGNVTAIKDGECVIYAKTSNNKEATCKVVVKPIEASSVSLNVTEKTLLIGEVFTLIATITPESTTYPEIEWSSSEPNVATVDSEGKVTAVEDGSCTIFAITKNRKYATCVITVSPIEVETITLNLTEKAVFIGEEFTLSATITPDNATYKEVEWSSSNSNIAAVDANGKVTAIKEGSCSIYAKVKNGKVATCSIIVSPIEVERINLDITEKTLEEGEEFILTATITPNNATYKDIEWASSNPNTASVDNNGKVSAIKEGECIIYAKTSNNKTAECKVVVKPISVKELKLSSSRVKLLVGETKQVTYTVTPSNAKIVDVKWHIEDTSIASVSDNGEVTCNKLGTTKLTVTINGEYSAECEIAGCTIEEFISLSFGSMSYSSVGGYVTGNFACYMSNSSSQSVVVQYIQLIDSYSGTAYNKMTVENGVIEANSSKGYGINIQRQIYQPIFRWGYTHDGKEYTKDIKFNK